MNKTLTIGEILSYIVSQESSREGGYAEYALNEESKNRGNPLQHQEELKQAILQWVADEVVGKEADVFTESGGSITKMNILDYQNTLKRNQRQILKAHVWKK